MKISIITPTHNRKYLKETYESIKAQDFLEWVIVRNGEALKQDFSEFYKDKRVKIFDLDIHIDYIGSLKRFACSKAQGDIILELDHDDLLTPDAVEEVEKAFEDKEIGFVYSNAAYFKNDWSKPQRFNPVFGWKWREFEYQGHKLDEIISFEPTPASISKIWFAPDHLRAWRKDIYDKVGGHNKDMRVLDDGELMMRMYLITKFKHIDKCLYLYRVSDTSTSQNSRNAEIQANVMPLYSRYIYQLVERWCDLNGLQKLDLGGGFGCPAGWESVDLENGKIKADLNEKWPFEDNSIGAIRAVNIMEHIPNKIHFINEAYRVLKPGGYFISMTPSTDGRGAFQDPTHCAFYNENSFWYYTKSFYQKFTPEVKAKFQTMRLETIYPSEFEKQNNIPYVVFDSTKIGGERLPGIIEY